MARRPLKQAAYILQALLLGLFFGISWSLPVDWASALGGWIGRTVGPRMGQNRKAMRNLERAMPDNSPAENRRIILGMWDNLGRVMAEYPHLGTICAKLEGGRVELIGLEHWRAMQGNGKPGIAFGGHLANWEVLPRLAGLTGLDLALIYRAPNNPWVDSMLRRFRRSRQLFRKGQEGARALYGVLRQGGHVAMLVDQKMNDGIAVPFFGRAAMTAPAIAQFGLRLGCTLLPARTERLNGARFRVTVYPPLELRPTGTPTGDRGADEREIMVRINAMIEDWVRDKPEQWLWLHRRWPD